MDKLELAKQLHEDIKIAKQTAQTMVRYADIPQVEKDKLISVYDAWKSGEVVSVGDIRRFEGVLYEVIQAHTTQADWIPTTTPALWKLFTPKTTETGEEIIPDFKQPAGAHDAYKLGDKVMFDGKIYESLIDNNSYSPSAYPQGWKLVP